MLLYLTTAWGMAQETNTTIQFTAQLIQVWTSRDWNGGSEGDHSGLPTPKLLFKEMAIKLYLFTVKLQLFADRSSYLPT